MRTTWLPILFPSEVCIKTIGIWTTSHFALWRCSTWRMTRYLCLIAENDSMEEQKFPYKEAKLSVYVQVVCFNFPRVVMLFSSEVWIKTNRIWITSHFVLSRCHTWRMATWQDNVGRYLSCVPGRGSWGRISKLDEAPDVIYEVSLTTPYTWSFL